MRKFKTKKTRKIKFKTYIIIILISFCFSMFIFNKANTDNIIEISINNLTNNIKEKLNEQDIPTIVETANIKEYLDKNKLKYKYSYNASKHFMKIAKTKNKSLNYFIDLHRDSVKKNLTTLTYKNKKYAKVMFIIGADHDNYKQNLKLAENINNALTLKIPGISRGVLKKSGRNVNGIYNQDFNPNTILIELGGIDNTIEEVNNTMEVLAVVLSNYIKNKEESL